MNPFAVELVDNLIVYPDSRCYAAILGTSPSKGARSPALWNAAFAAQGIDATMLPFDVSETHLEKLLAALEADPLFLGGAVAVPHKEAVACWLGGRMTPEAQMIGAVNCLYRGADGRLMGTNTDGEGARVSFENQFGSLLGKKVMLLGPGGAGKAVSAFFACAVGMSGQLIISGRSATGQTYANRIGCNWLGWDDLVSALPRMDVLINCTTVGSGASTEGSPVSAALLDLLPHQAIVFDIIYQPSPTVLLNFAARRGLGVLDGTGMNLEQAILAFGHAVSQPKGAEATRSAMEHAKRVQ